VDYIADNIDLLPETLASELCRRLGEDDPPSLRGVLYLVRAALAMRKKTTPEADAVWADLRSEHRQLHQRTACYEDTSLLVMESILIDGTCRSSA
jgi:hypothetical protein